MYKSRLEKKLGLNRQHLESIEEALAEEMTDDDRRALEEVLKEHEEGKTIRFTKTRNRGD